MTDKYSAEALRTDINRIKHKLRGVGKVKQTRLYTFSHMVMGGIMMMFFAGVALGVYFTLTESDGLTVTLDFIMELAKIVTLGYFIKAFGENIAKIVISALFGAKFPERDGRDING